MGAFGSSIFLPEFLAPGDNSRLAWVVPPLPGLGGEKRWGKKFGYVYAWVIYNSAGASGGGAGLADVNIRFHDPLCVFACLGNLFSFALFPPYHTGVLPGGLKSPFVDFAS